MPESLSLRHHHPFHHNHFSHLRREVCPTKLLWSVSSYSRIPFTQDPNSIFNITTFCFFDAFSSLLDNSLLIINPCKMSPQLMMETKRLWFFFLCVNWITNTQWPINDRPWRKWHDWSLIMMCTYHLHRNLWTEEVVAKFLLYVIIHSKYTVVTEIWTLF